MPRLRHLGYFVSDWVMYILSGTKGTAYTLMTSKDKEFAGHLVRNLEGANQEVPRELLELALQVFIFQANPSFSKNASI